VNPMKVAELSL